MFESYLDFFGAAAPYRCAFHTGDGVPDGLAPLPYHELYTGGAPKERAAAMLWRDDAALHVAALMEDSDVHSDAVGKNDRTWSKGDVMELFFQAAGHEDYVELHLAPNLATLELHFPSVAVFGQRQVRGSVLRVRVQDRHRASARRLARQGLVGQDGRPPGAPRRRRGPGRGPFQRLPLQLQPGLGENRRSAPAPATPPEASTSRNTGTP